MKHLRLRPNTRRQPSVVKDKASEEVTETVHPVSIWSVPRGPQIVINPMNIHSFSVQGIKSQFSYWCYILKIKKYNKIEVVLIFSIWTLSLLGIKDPTEINEVVTETTSVLNNVQIEDLQTFSLLTCIVEMIINLVCTFGMLAWQKCYKIYFKKYFLTDCVDCACSLFQIFFKSNNYDEVQKCHF